MLHKDQAVPGATLRVNEVIKWGLPGNMGGGGLDNIKETLSIMPGVEVTSGTILQVLKKPRKVDRANCCRVRVVDTLQEGEVWWCELRASTTLVIE